MKNNTLLIITNNNIGFGLSGGDRIVVNLIKSWSHKLNIITLGSAEAKSLFSKYNVLPKVFLQTDKASSKHILNTPELIVHQIRRTILGIICILKNRKLLRSVNYVYTSSDFYPDLFLGLILKLIFPKIKWIAGYYLLAPNPISQKSNYNINHQYLRGFIYYIGQIPTKFFVKLSADYVFVTSKPDIKYFITKRITQNNIFIIQGGVDTVNYQKYLHSNSYIIPSKRKYHAVYLGRFHTQKGVTQLVEIWNIVTKTIPQVKLIMIGNGQLENNVKSLIKQYNLQKNIILTGFMDGSPKIKIFQNSRIVVHPAIYDSGGMAAAEAMSWGLPGVSFDLPALKTYYPKGMLKSKPHDLMDFSKNIISLIKNETLYKKLSDEALDLIKTNWNWATRFNNIYKNIFNEDK